MICSSAIAFVGLLPTYGMPHQADEEIAEILLIKDRAAC